MEKRNEYAFMDDPIMDEPPDPHVRGTVRTAKGTKTWVGQPRPKGWTVDDWEKFTTERWERIFGKNGGSDERNIVDKSKTVEPQ